MDDLDLALIASILRDGKPSFKRARERGLRADLLRGSGKAIFEFLAEYHLRFDDLPPKEVVLGKLGIPLPLVPSNLYSDFLVDEIFNRKTYEFVYNGYKQLEELLIAKPPNVKQLTGKLEELVLNLRREQLTEVKVESMFALGKEVIAHYERIKSGERGILTPWPNVNEATLGFWPEDLVIFVSRSGIGKSWTAILLALCAWQQGKKVLFATTEMSKLRIAMRLYAALCKLPYKEFTHGKLTIHSEPRLYETVEKMLHQEGLYVIGGNFDFRTESLSTAIDEVRPDVLLMDGAYLLKSQGKDRSERAANSFDDLKRITIRHGIPVLATHQFNREVKTNVATSVKAESISLTDVANWNASVIYGLVQTDDMKRDKRLIFKPLKLREGTGDEVEVNWDLDTMNFSEIGIVRHGTKDSGDSAEYDSGAGSTDTTIGNDTVPF